MIDVNSIICTRMNQNGLQVVLGDNSLVRIKRISRSQWSVEYIKMNGEYMMYFVNKLARAFTRFSNVQILAA